MYRRNDDGQIIDPPTIPEREREIYGVMQSDPGNTRKIERLTRDYERERTELAEAEEQDEREAAEDQAAQDASAREAVRARNAPQTDAARPDHAQGPDQSQDPASGQQQTNNPSATIPGFGGNR